MIDYIGRPEEALREAYAKALIFGEALPKVGSMCVRVTDVSRKGVKFKVTLATAKGDDLITVVETDWIGKGCSMNMLDVDRAFNINVTLSSFR